jgi:hypothetical protein
MADIVEINDGTNVSIVEIVVDGTIEVQSSNDQIIVQLDQGPQGATGPSGIYISSTPPSDTSLIWADINDVTIGHSYVTKTKTSAYTVLPTDEIIICNATSGSFNITLPTAASSFGRKFFFKKIDTSSNLVTLLGTIESDVNITLGPGIDDVTIFSNGSNFYYWGF